MHTDDAATSSGKYGVSIMSDEERIAILADAILEAISAEDVQATGTER